MKITSVASVLLAAACVLAAPVSFAADSVAAPKVAAAASAPKLKKPAARVKGVDVNNATKAELKTLKNVTDELADKIIAGRPYNSKSWLVTHKVIPESVYFENKEAIYITLAHQAKSSVKTKAAVNK